MEITAINSVLHQNLIYQVSANNAILNAMSVKIFLTDARNAQFLDFF